MCLLVSGGHNLLLLVEGVGCYTQLGTTLDDALGASPVQWNQTCARRGASAPEYEARTGRSAEALSCTNCCISSTEMSSTL